MADIEFVSGGIHLSVWRSRPPLVVRDLGNHRMPFSRPRPPFWIITTYN
jgi:hypothetical protein